MPKYTFGYKLHIEPPVIPDPPEYDIKNTFIMYAAEESKIEFTQLSDYKDLVITKLSGTEFADSIDEVIGLDKILFGNSKDECEFTLPSGKYVKMDIGYDIKNNPDDSDKRTIYPIGKFKISGAVDLIGDTVGLSPEAGVGGNDGAFYQLFAGCDIRYAHDFTVDVHIAAWLYEEMFSNCKNLITTPKIINISTDNGGDKLDSMFENCDKLETVTKLHFLNTIGGCDNRDNTFANCIKLNRINFRSDKPNWNLNTSLGNDSFDNWLKNVSPTGTFAMTAADAACFKNQGIEFGPNTIPVGWNIIDIDDNSIIYYDAVSGTWDSTL